MIKIKNAHHIVRKILMAQLPKAFAPITNPNPLGAHCAALDVGLLTQIEVQIHQYCPASPPIAFARDD
jgi:hypothetical protein